LAVLGLAEVAKGLRQQLQVHALYGAIAMRLAKFLADAGVASRRAAEKIIRSRKVTVDGVTVDDPAWAVSADNVVTVDGKPLSSAPERVVYAVNKPEGVVSTASDPQGRPTVVSLVPSPLRLYPVGRLDIDTTGLILLTNEGSLAHRLTHPSFEIPKTYRALVADGPITDEAVQALSDGVVLDDGLTAPAQVQRLAPDTLELTIHEGRKRQVRRMCAQVGHPVVRLERLAVGPLLLGDLRPGAHRRLAPREIEALMAATAPEARRGADESYGGPPTRPPA
jgi:23S rRNA pseudouridine2605 synthase